nr:hypothetical protein [Bacilli bacterium]
MRNKKRNALLPIFFACGMMLSACGGGTPKYTVTWKNYDGNVLEVDENVKKGETPSYDGTAPTKEGDAQYSYAFKGWDPAISEVTADVTYTAQFEQTVKSYTITWANEDGTVIKTDTVEYGQVPNYDGAAPEKQGDAQYTYTFTGWDPTPVAVTGNATYVAQFGQSVNNYTVTWKNADGDTLETDTVQYGDLPKFDGTEPTKAGDETSPMYRFLGWDRNLELPIVEDTVITAQYQNYVKEAVVDDFESYAESAEVLDAGWYAIGWKDGGWSSESGATVSLGTRSEEGQKALRFDAWENGNNYAIVGTIDGTKIGGAVNALKFRLMVPEMNDIRIKVYAKSVMYNGQLKQPWFKYALGKPVSSEYVEYTLSLDDPKWDLWDQHQLNMVTGAQLLGLHQDDIPAMLEKIEIYSSGNDGNGWPYIAFLDSVKFVTELGVVSTQKEAITVYDRYTGVNTLGNTIRIDIGENGAATASVIDLETPQVIPGTYEVDDEHVVTFTSADQGATLVYKGRLHNGGKDIKFVSAEG